MPPSIFRTGDGKHSCLVVGGRREGTSFLRLLFHLVQKHCVLNLSTQTWWGCWWYTLWHNMLWRVGMNRQRFDHMAHLFGHIIQVFSTQISICAIDSTIIQCNTIITMFLLLPVLARLEWETRNRTNWSGSLPSFLQQGHKHTFLYVQPNNNNNNNL